MSFNPTTANPYLSVVATARNDDHGGNLIGRMQLFVSGLIEQCNRHGVEAELVLVEWNPPPDKPRLAEVLRWPSTCGKCTVRIVEVPPEVHHRLSHADKLPLFQMIGKNVGIRRARGEYVLATNIDILFSDAVFEFLKSGQMKPGFIYRTDRLDVPPEIPCDTPLRGQLEFCRKNVIRRHIFEGSYDCRIRKWVSRRVDAWTWRGRFYAIRHRMLMEARTLNNNAGNFRRRTAHRLAMQYRTRRNQVLNRCRWVYHKTRALLVNRSRWVYHKARVQYRSIRNYTLNRARWVYHMLRDRFRRLVHFSWRLLRSAVRFVKSLARLLLLMLVAPFWWFYTRVFVPFRIRRRGTRLGRVIDWLEHNYPLTYLRCALPVLREHVRSTARVRYKYTAMCARDMLPRWLDRSRLVPARSTIGCREDRKRALREYLDVLQSADLSARIGRAATRRYRRHRREQLEIANSPEGVIAEQLEQHRLALAQVAEAKRRRKLAKQRQKEILKRKEQRLKEEALRRQKAERKQQKRRQHFQALQRKTAAERERRLAEERKRKRQPQAERRQKAERSNFNAQPQVDGRRNGSTHGERRQPDRFSAWQHGDSSQIQHEHEAAEQTLAQELASQSECAAAKFDTCGAEPGSFQGNGSADHELALVAADCENCDAEQDSAQVNGSGGDEVAQAITEPSDSQPIQQEGPQLQTSEIAPFWRRAIVWLGSGKPRIPIQRPHLHTYACGDFTMLAKADWEALRGYAEFQMYSMHIDSLFLVAGAHHGLKQRLLGKEAAIYHIEHGLGSGWTPEGEEKLNKRLADAGIPQISYHQYVEYDAQMAIAGRADIVNDEQWGFGDISLPETVIQ